MRYCFPIFLFSLPYSIVAARRQARRFFKSKKQGILKAGLLTTCILTVALIAVDRLTSHGRHITHRKIILPLETSKQVEVSELISKNHSVPQKFCPEAPAGMSLSTSILLWFLTSLELCLIHSQHYLCLCPPGAGVDAAVKAALRCILRGTIPATTAEAVAAAAAAAAPRWTGPFDGMYLAG